MNTACETDIVAWANEQATQRQLLAYALAAEPDEVS